MSTQARWFTLPEREPLSRQTEVTAQHVVVVGGGLAGCHTAFELAERGIGVMLIDASSTIAGGASGNQAGIVKPFVTRAPHLADQFYQAAFTYLLNRFDADKALLEAAQFKQCGVLQLVEHPYPENDAYANCNAHQASVLAGTVIDSNAINFALGGWLNISALCHALVQHQEIDVRLDLSVTDIKQTATGWCVTTKHTNEGCGTDNKNTQQTLACKNLILANGEQLNQFTQTQALPITCARGQTSRFYGANTSTLNTVVTGKRYAIPDGKDIIVGASFIRDDKDKQLRDADHQHNLDGLRTMLPSVSVAPNSPSGFCATRATTPDRLPVVGAVPLFSAYQSDYRLIKNGLPDNRFPFPRYQAGLYVIGGFGSRGIVSAPYCAKLLADYLCGEMGRGPSNNLQTDQVPDRIGLADWPSLLHPGRFLIRDLKRGNPLVY